MSYSAVNKVDVNYVTPTLTRTRPEQELGEVTVRSSRRSPKSVVTTIALDKQAAKLAGLRRGQRVSLLRGTGKDSGKIRIVANSDGALKIGESYTRPEFHLSISSARLLNSAVKMKNARVISYAKGAITLAV